MPLQQSTSTSHVTCETQDGPGTNILVGDETTSDRPKLSSMETKSQATYSKPDSQVSGKSISLVTWKDELGPSSCSAEEEAAKVAAELKAYQETNNSQPRKKHKRTHTTPFVLTQELKEYRRLMDADEKWDKELTTVHGLSKGEAGLVSDIVMKYANSEDFPKEDLEESPKLLLLARQGWEYLRALTPIFQKHVLPHGWYHKKDPETCEWTVVKTGGN